MAHISLMGNQTMYLLLTQTYAITLVAWFQFQHFSVCTVMGRKDSVVDSLFMSMPVVKMWTAAILDC